jgi:hyaluronan synthase
VWLYRHKFLAYWLVDKVVSSFTLLLAPSFMALALVEGHFAFTGILAAWWQFSRSAKMLAHLERRKMHFFTMMPVYILMSFVMCGVKIAALLSIREQKWLTRDVAVTAAGKEATRTAPTPTVEPVRAREVGA